MSFSHSIVLLLCCNIQNVTPHNKKSSTNMKPMMMFCVLFFRWEGMPEKSDLIVQMCANPMSDNVFFPFPTVPQGVFPKSYKMTSYLDFHFFYFLSSLLSFTPECYFFLGNKDENLGFLLENKNSCFCCCSHCKCHIRCLPD